MKLNIIGVLFAAGVGLAVASPAEAQVQVADQSADRSHVAALSGNNGPDNAVWVVPALFIAGFAAGYGVRSLISYRRHRREFRLTVGDFTPSHRLQVEADNPQLALRLVPRDDAGDLQSPQRPSRGVT